MALCWFCHWGWPKPIWDIYERAEKDIDAVLARHPEVDDPRNGEYALKFGLAHCIWEDENFDSLDFELQNCEAILSDKPMAEGMGWMERFRDWPREVVEIILRSLRELAALPLEMREPPKEYEADDWHPEKYPPAVGMEMVK